MTIGMQKDGVSAEEIRKQLAGQDEAGMQQARELIQTFSIFQVQAEKLSVVGKACDDLQLTQTATRSLPGAGRSDQLPV